MTKLLKEKLIKFTTDGLCLEVDNKAMENIFNNKMNLIRIKFKQIGLDIKLNIVVK